MTGTVTWGTTVGSLPWGDPRENRGFHKGHSAADPYNQVAGNGAGCPYGGAASSRRRGTVSDAADTRQKNALSAQDSDWKQFVTKIERIDNWADTQRLQRQAEKRREEQEKAEGGRRAYR